MKSSPKVAIILPVFNTEKYLKECLDSIINQDYKNIIIYAIDDGSTDNSLNILNYYSNKIRLYMYSTRKIPAFPQPEI